MIAPLAVKNQPSKKVVFPYSKAMFPKSVFFKSISHSSFGLEFKTHLQ